MSTQTCLVDSDQPLGALSGVVVDFEAGSAGSALLQVVVEVLQVRAFLAVLGIVIEVGGIERTLQRVFEGLPLGDESLELFSAVVFADDPQFVGQVGVEVGLLLAGVGLAVVVVGGDAVDALLEV